jgi:hypothetical protein
MRKQLTLCCALLWQANAMAENTISVAPGASTQNAEATFAAAVRLFKSGDSGALGISRKNTTEPALEFAPGMARVSYRGSF